jgi:hypothetical protein
MEKSYILSLTSQDDYRALFYRTTGFAPRIEAFFRENPNGQLIGDGIHLSLAGRVRLMQYLAEWISRLSDL